MVAQAYDVSREKQDQYAMYSHTRAQAVRFPSCPLDFEVADRGVFQALEKGLFAEEIIPIEIGGKVISVDDTIRKGVTLESLAGLKPVFEWGDRRSTAGNSAGVGDGAALCVLTTRKRAEAEGFDILGKYVASAFVGVEPRYMGISPIAAIPKILEQTGLTKEDIDIFEVRSRYRNSVEGPCLRAID